MVLVVAFGGVQKTPKTAGFFMVAGLKPRKNAGFYAVGASKPRKNACFLVGGAKKRRKYAGFGGLWSLQSAAS